MSVSGRGFSSEKEGNEGKKIEKGEQSKEGICREGEVVCTCAACRAIQLVDIAFDGCIVYLTIQFVSLGRKHARNLVLFHFLHADT